MAVQLSKRDIAGANAQQEVYGAQNMALESENARLKDELEDMQKTVETLKRVVAEYSKKQ
jgi:cell division protein FtsB